MGVDYGGTVKKKKGLWQEKERVRVVVGQVFGAYLKREVEASLAASEEASLLRSTY